ncbi:MAG: hypothetical protein E7104_04385 [Prevotella sp.]|nr:hypothetical protein [Prevotella sp.]
MISNEEKQRIISELNNRINSGDIKCPMCGNKHFIIADGYFNSIMQDSLNGIVLGGPSIPSIAIVCSKCGFISSHALGVLGLLPKPNENSQKGDENGK